MNQETNIAAPWKRHLLTALVVIATLVGLAGLAFSAPPEGSVKIMRQVRIMEGIVDKVLLDSPNFLVHSGNNTHGLYIPEYGAIFTFEASLATGMFGISDLKVSIPKFEVQTDSDGNKTIVLKNLEKAEKNAEKAKQEAAKAEAEAQKLSQADASGDSESSGSSSDDDEKDSAQLYQKGKVELIQALLDYGETLTQLKSGQWIVLAAFLQNDSYFEKNKLSRLVVKAKIDDLRGFSAGSIDEKTMRSKILVEEY
jgi:hypothetical protein